MGDQQVRQATSHIFQQLTRLVILLGTVLIVQLFTAGRPESAIEVDLYIKQLRSGDDKTRANAADALGKIGPAAATAVADLRNALNNDRDEFVRGQSAFALGRMGPAGYAAVDDLRRALGDSSPLPRVTAAVALGEMGPAAQTAVDDLRKALRSDAEARVRQAVALALNRMGPGAHAAADDLGKALSRDPDEVVRLWAASALGSIGPAAAVAVVSLRNALNSDGVTSVRRSAAYSLGLMGPAGSSSVSDLRNALNHDSDPDVRSNAAFALGWIGVAAQVAVGDLRNALNNDRHVKVRQRAASALARVATGDQASIDDLRRALHDSDAELRKSAAESLGTIGSSAQAVADDLRSAAGSDSDPAVRTAAAAALRHIAHAVLSSARGQSDHQLRLAARRLTEIAETLASAGFRRERDDVTAYRDSLTGELHSFRVSPLIKTHWQWLLLPSYVLVMLSTWSLMLWSRPIAILRLNQTLKRHADVRITWPVDITLSLRTLLLITPFHCRQRVLDAWVRAHLAAARDRFSGRDTVHAHAVHIALPATLDGQVVPELLGRLLRRTFAKNVGCLLIQGEGGAGKTSLACQIGRWATSDDQDLRPSAQAMLPVLVEDDFDGSFLDSIRRQLQLLVDAPKPIPEDLCEELLRQRRVLVIVDHLSELSDTTRAKIQPGQHDFPANAIVVTSRLDEKLGGVPKTILRPLRLQRDRLSPFMANYLAQRGKGDLFTDSEFHAALSQLTRMIEGQGRDVTVLLARLYAEQMINAREAGNERLPESIPDLMLGYVNILNTAISNTRRADTEVHRDAMALAWACIEATFRPGYATLASAKASLEGDDVPTRLDYLERRLQIIQTLQPAQDRIRFLLDPLAEYLAALYLVTRNANDEAAWHRFFEQTDGMPGAPTAVGAFLVAVRDCCLAKGQGQVPAFVEGELNHRIGQTISNGEPAVSG